MAVECDTFSISLLLLLLCKVLDNGYNGFSFSDHCVEEGDSIPLLQGYGQTLKQKECFSGVRSD